MILLQIQVKINDLNAAWDALQRTFATYKKMCEYNLEAQVKQNFLK